MSDLVDRRSYISCSFCGKTSDEVKKIITGLSVLANICDECIILCHEIIAKSSAKEGLIAKVLEPAEGEEGPKVLIPQQRWINAHTTLNNDIRMNIKRGNIDEAVKKIDMLINLYALRYI